MNTERAADVDRYYDVLEKAVAGNPRGQLALAGLMNVLAETDREALTDTLTGLPNRRALQQRDFYDLGRTLTAVVTEERRRTVEIPEPAGWGVIYADLDEFKLVNDVLGHEVGDRVLQFFAFALRCSIRQEDEVYRVGGDEFLVFMPLQQKLQTADVLGTELSTRIMTVMPEIGRRAYSAVLPSYLEITPLDQEALQVISVTIGAELAPGPQINRHEWMLRSEELMREAKSRRGRV